MVMEERIRAALTVAFAPIRLSIINESHLHAGHRGFPGTESSHFRVHVVSARFEGVSRIDRHRLVNEALSAELKDGVHALAIKAEAPAQD